MEEIAIKKEQQQPRFESVAQMSTVDVYKFGAQHDDMPAIESVDLKDGTKGEIMWLPKGVTSHPEVRFAWLSPRSRELQRTATGVKPTDEFAKQTVLTIQKNLETGSYGATITLVGMQRSASAVAAAKSDWL